MLFRFGKIHATTCEACTGWHAKNAEDLFQSLDAAAFIGGYNVMLFDLPFLRKKFRIPDNRYRRWLAKVLDPFHVAKEGLGRWFSLQKMLLANGLPSKSGDGQNAIQLVHKSKWDELQRYCMDDTILSHQLLCLQQIKLPGGIDAYMYVQAAAATSSSRSDSGKVRLVLKFKNTGRGGFVLVRTKRPTVSTTTQQQQLAATTAAEEEEEGTAEDGH